MQIQPKWKQSLAAVLGAGAMLVVTSVGAAEPDPPHHLLLAEEVAETIVPSANSYNSPAKVTWAGENGLEHSTVRAKCASFVTQVLKKAYGVDLEPWFGSSSPNSTCYHDTIEVEDGFTLIEDVKDVRPGDIVAIRYDDAGCKILSCGSHIGCSSSGHTMLVESIPTPRAATAPEIPGTKQYTLAVVDVTSAPHGPSDSRWQANPDESHDQGVGTGEVRLYVDADDPDRSIVGYTWSTSKSSEYHPQSQRDLVIGRYVGP